MAELYALQFQMMQSQDTSITNFLTVCQIWNFHEKLNQAGKKCK